MRISRPSLSGEHQPDDLNTHQTPIVRRSILFIIVLLLVAAASILVWRWYSPLGRRLDPVPESEKEPSTGDAATAGQERDPVCGGPPAMMILLVGKDVSPQTPGDPNDYDQGFADAIRLVRVDFVEPGVSMVAIPRDIWVPIPGMDQYGIEANRLKLAYAYGYHYFEDDYGPVLLARTLTTNFDVSLDHYVVVSLQAFVDGIDAIGGIDLVFSEPLDLRSDSGSGYYYPAGRNHLDGKATLDFARARPDNSSDLFRIDRQTEIITAIQERVLTPEVLPLVPRLAQSMRSSVLTDLSPADISALVCLTRELDSSDIEAITLAEDSYTVVEDQLGYQVFLPDFELMTAYLAAFEAGEIPLDAN